jgi:hypothetical protein
MIYSHVAPDFMAAEMARLSFAPAHATMMTSMDDARRRYSDGAEDQAPAAAVSP